MTHIRRASFKRAPWLAVLLILLLGILTFLICQNYHNRPRPLSQTSDLLRTEFAFARIEYGESDGTGIYQEVSIPVAEFQRILSDVSAVPGRSTTAMPEKFFYLYGSDHEGFVDIAVGNNGEIIFGRSGEHQHWEDISRTAYDELYQSAFETVH